MCTCADELRWSQPQVLGDAPICGNRHASVLVDDHTQPLLASMLVFAADMHDTFATIYALRFRDGLHGNGFRWVPQSTAGRAPLSRARPSLTLLDKHVFVVCGVAAGKPLSTVAMLDVHNYVWSLPTIDGVPPPARMGATATRVGTDLFIFGGSDGKSSLRDLNVLVYVTWFTPPYGGRQPPARVGHTLTLVGSKLYLLGGASQGVAYNDLFVLDPTAQTWSRPPMYGAPPDALVGHTTVAVGAELIVWGGGDGRRAHSGLNVVDTHNLLWSRPQTSGSEPLAHVGHSAVHADAKMYIFGGYGQQQYWNELVVLDTGIMVWIRPHTTGTPPEQCVLHSANLIWSSTGWVMVIYGGSFEEKPIDQIFALDISHMRWSNIGHLVWEGPRPAPRFGHGATAIGSKLFIFGGTSGGVPDKWSSYMAGSGFVTGYEGGARNDLCVIDLQTRQFTLPNYGGERPGPVYRVAAVSHRGKLFLFGGVGSDGSVSLLDTGLSGSADQAHPPGDASTANAGLVETAAAEFFAAENAGGGGGGGSIKSGGGLGRASEMTRGLDASASAALVQLLQEIGLNKYARLFLRQEVDVDSLLQLSDRDLKDMGLSAIGARRKLIAAIHKHKLHRLGEADGSAGSGMAGRGLPGSGSAVGASEAGASSSGSADPAVATAGEVFRQRYKLNGRTYLGGSARVVLGEDVKTGGAVAVKVHTSHAYFTREVKLLKHLHSEYIVAMLDAYDEEESPPTIILEGGTCSLSEILAQGQLSGVERKLVLERLCLAVDFMHAKNFVLVDLKPQNAVVFGSLLGLKLIDLECVRKVGEPTPFKLTPFYAPPELAAAALETMRLGQLPSLEYHAAEGTGAGAGAEADGASNKWGPNLRNLALLSENPTLARAVAAASRVANRAGSGASDLNRDDLKQLEAPLKLPNGKPLRAQTAMDVWSLGMMAYELFVNEPFFAGCSDDVALQVLASQASLDLPTARIAEPHAVHLLSKILQKRPKERATVEGILRHAYLVGGLDTQQVGGSFAMLHESQQTFKGELGKIQDNVGTGPRPDSSASPAGFDPMAVMRSGTQSHKSRGADKRAKFAESESEYPRESVLGRAGKGPPA
jgi:serine/threonine protein kinase/uncharacterized protein YjiS (DUF1127 family)